MGKWTDEALRIRPLYQKGAQHLDDAEALEIKGIYPEWKALLDENHKDHTVKKDFKFRLGDKLYKTEQPEYTFTDTYVPGSVGTESLFSVIDETHAGTLDDPIPAVSGMLYVKGLYYLDPGDGKTYLCIRQDTEEGTTLYALPSQLVGNYFEEVTGE